MSTLLYTYMHILVCNSKYAFTLILIINYRDCKCCCCQCSYMYICYVQTEVPKNSSLLLHGLHVTPTFCSSILHNPSLPLFFHLSYLSPSILLTNYEIITNLTVKIVIKHKLMVFDHLANKCMALIN